MNANSVETVCFSSFYCNKLYVRSLSNDKSNVLRKKNMNSLNLINFILNGTETNRRTVEIAEKLLPHTWNICIGLKKKFTEHAHDDFKQFFKGLKPISSDLYIDTDDVVKAFTRVIETIVPRDFYGCLKNRKLFYELVQIVLHSSFGEHIPISRITYKWDLNRIKWLSCIDDNGKRFVLGKFIVFIIKNVVCSITSIVFYVTTTRLTNETRRLYFFFKSTWQRIAGRFIAEMIKNGHLIKSTASSIGRKSKKTLPIGIRRTNRSILKDLPVLRLILKPNSMRPIVQHKRTDKKLDMTRRHLLRTIFPNPKRVSFDREYVALYNKWTELERPKLYFVKTDLTDAFGSVDMDGLRDILNRLHFEYQKTETLVNRKRFICVEFRKFITELKRPRFVRWGSCAYEWKRGLVQGQQHSPILCEIYYSDFDAKYLANFNKQTTGINLLVRIVDDYLFVSDDQETALDFRNHMMKSGRINPDKTVDNFTSRFINFYGFRIDTETLEVIKDNVGQLRYRFSFNQSMYDKNNLPKRFSHVGLVSPLFFNSRINSEMALWRNIYASLLISANKFCTIVSQVYFDGIDADRLFQIYKERIGIKMCNYIVRTIKENKSPDVVFPYCINHFRFLAYKALKIASSSNICMKLQPIIKVYLNKTNCSSGRWSPHHRSIDNNGLPIQSAVKEICRRPQTRRCLDSVAGNQ